MRKQKFNFPVRLITVIIIILAAVLFMVGSLVKFLRTSDYFKVQEIIFSEKDLVNLAYLKGQNIFTINLENESGYIAQHYPNYSKVRLVRVLPKRIFVALIKRNPVAIIKLYRHFLVDKEAVVFEVAGPLPEQDLPIITGLETKIFGPKKGSKYNIKELNVALNIIGELKLSRVLRNYQIKKIDVASLGSASIFLSVGLTETKELEIKLDADNIKEKVNVLAGLINQVKPDLNNIKYIDLRFKDPVIKFNEDKS